MASGLRAIPDVVRQISATTFTGSFQKIGTPLRLPSPLIKIVNNTSVLVTISWDGVNIHDVLPATTFTLYDFCSDAGTVNGLYVPQGTQFWVNAAAGTGSLYLIVFYTSEQ